MDSARNNFFEEYKNKGNRIMLKFDSFSTVGEIFQNGQEAIFYYEQAFQSSQANDNKASSRKNQGYASTRIASGLNDHEQEAIKLYYIYQAIGCYKEAYKFGTEMDKKWKDGVLQNSFSLWKMISQVLMMSDSGEKSLYFEEFASNLHPDFSQTIYQASFNLAKCYYNLALQSQVRKDFKKADQNINFAK